MTKKELTKEEQEKLQQNYMRLQMLSQEIQKTEKELQALETKRQDLEAIKKNIKEIHNIQNKETFIPIENGIFLKGKIEKTDKLIIGIGANILTEKTPEQTEQIITKKQTEIETNIKKTLKNLKRSKQTEDKINR